MANEQQRIYFDSALTPGNPLGSVGSFTLTFGGNTTGPIQWDYTDTAVAIQSALEMLAGIGSGNVLVTYEDGPTLLVEFKGALANTNVGAMTGIPTDMKQDAFGITVSVIEAGDQDHPQSDLITLSDGATEDGAALETVLDGAGFACSVSGNAGGPYTITSDAPGAVTITATSYPGEPLRKGLTTIEVVVEQEGTASGRGGGMSGMSGMSGMTCP
jgi:hypothetical protein